MKYSINLLFNLFIFMMMSSSCAQKGEIFVNNSENAVSANITTIFATAWQINSRLGKGVNISAFEADPSWQPPFNVSYFQTIKSLGFKHVRIPVKWDRSDRSMSNSPYTINPAFLSTIKGVVDAALQNKLHVIINMHLFTDLYNNPIQYKDKFLAQWTQISSYFKNYPDSLLFEVLNEPGYNLTPSLWNIYFAEALAKIRVNNPQRCVLIGTAMGGGVDGLDSLVIPNDNHLILTVHYYNPFHFTHQGANWVENSNTWLGTKWTDTQFERDAVVYDFGLVKAKSATIPVYVGEYGSYYMADITSRLRWTTFISNWVTQQGFSRAYWEFHQGFGFYDPNTSTVNTSLSNAILTTPLPSPTSVRLQTIYTSNFSSGYDGWDLHNNDQSVSSTKSISNGIVAVNITSSGNQEWLIQLMRGGFPIQSGKKYHISFIASTTINHPIKIFAYMAKSTSPWTVYSDYNHFYLTSGTASSYGFTFTANTTDNSSNIILSLGNTGIGEINISNIVFQKIL